MVLSLQPAGLPCLYELLYSAAPVRAVMLLTQTGVCGDGRRGTVLPAGCRALHSSRGHSSGAQGERSCKKQALTHNFMQKDSNDTFLLDPAAKLEVQIGCQAGKRSCKLCGCTVAQVGSVTLS